jgi:hypothetical protein
MPSQSTGIRLKNSAHPSGFIKHEILEPRGLSVTDVARILGVGRPVLFTLVDQRTPPSLSWPCAWKSPSVSLNTISSQARPPNALKSHKKLKEK